MASEITYEVQELVGFIEKRWKIVTYPFEDLSHAKSHYQHYCQQFPELKFRLVKVEANRTVIKVKEQE